MKLKQNILLVVVAMFWFSQYVYVPYQTPFLLSLGVGAGIIGIVTGAYGLTQFLFRMPIGIMADLKSRHKFFIFLGVGSASLASLLRIFMPNELGFILANLLSGFASSMWISFMVLYSNYFKAKDLQKATGKIIGANNLGIFLGFACGMFFYQKMGMIFLCELAVIMGSLGLILSFFVLEPKESKIIPSSPLELICIYGNKRLIMFSLLALIQQGIMMATAMSFTTAVLKEMGASGFLIGLNSIFYIGGTTLGAYYSSFKLAEKLAPKSWISICFLSLAFYCAVLVYLPNIFWIGVVQLVAGIATGILTSYCTSEAMQEVPLEKKSTAMGFYQSIYAIGMTLVPVFTGNIVGRWNIAAGFWFLCFLCLGGIALVKYFYKSQKSFLREK